MVLLGRLRTFYPSLMDALRRALAALLSLLLATAPAAAAERGIPSVPKLSTPAAPVASSAPKLPTLPSGPGLALAATLSLGTIQQQPNAAPQAASVQISAALPQLQTAAQPGEGGAPAVNAAPIFDGSVKLSNAGGSSSGPSGAPQPGDPKGPRLEPSAPQPQKPKSWLRRLNEAAQAESKTEKVFERSLMLGIAAAVIAPVALKMVPAHFIALSAPLAFVVPAIVGTAVAVYRVGRFLLGKSPAAAPRGPPRLLKTAAAAGLAIGLAFGAVPMIGHGEAVQALEHYRAPKTEAVLVPGSTLPKAVADTLSKNPVGRDVLDHLRDRFGVLRLPVFLVRTEENAVASHAAIEDAVYIGRGEITAYGWTVEEFLRDPAKQLKYIEDNQDTFAHELRHANQARRSILEPGQLKNTMEYEYEAYLTEHFYNHERLKADPQVKLDAGSLGSYEMILDDVDDYLRQLDTYEAYKDNVHLDSPRYRAYFAALHKDWYAHRIEGYALLVERYKGGKNPLLARAYERKAREIAAKTGLPLPPSLQEK